MEPSTSDGRDGSASSMPIDASESDAAAAVPVPAQEQASNDVAAEQEPCKRCISNVGKMGKHTCSKRRANPNADSAAAQKRTRSTRLSAGTPVEPNGSDEPASFTLSDRAQLQLGTTPTPPAGASIMPALPASASTLELARADDASILTVAGITPMLPEEDQEAPIVEAEGPPTSALLSAARDEELVSDAMIDRSI